MTKRPPSTSNCAPFYPIHVRNTPHPEKREDDTHHILAQIARQKHRRPRQIRRLARPPQRYPALHIRLLLRIRQVGVVELGADGAGQQGVAADVVLAEGAGARLHQAEHAGLGGRVVGLAAAADERADGRDADDGAAATLRRHLARGGLRRVEGAAEVGVERKLPVLRVEAAAHIHVNDCISRQGEKKNTHSRKSANRHTPALLTNTSSRPNAPTVSSTSRFAVSGFEMSPGTAISWPSAGFSASICSNCTADFSSPRWLMATLAPWRRYSRAMARPMPVAPPVMAATLLTRSWVVILSFSPPVLRRRWYWPGLGGGGGWRWRGSGEGVESDVEVRTEKQWIDGNGESRRTDTETEEEEP